mmetsp:Transcript_37127/g.47987  ORF Transcript_37127/g.47987 Transcript_37127/m.47987 type:complete len:144 (-) Transcript_37127:277-708(-)
MPHLSDQIIPARFLLTLGHFVALCLVTYTKEHNIYAVYDSPSSSEKQAYLSEMETAMNFAYICFAFDFFGMVSGSTIFMNKINLFQIIIHFLGGVCISTFIHDNWGYHYLWPLVLSFSLPTALIEVWMLIATHVLRIVIYGGD